MTLAKEAWKYFGWVDTFPSLWVVICLLRVKTTSRKLSINKNPIPSNFHLTRLVGKCLTPVHNVYFVMYDVTVSFMAQVLDTVTYFVSQRHNKIALCASTDWPSRDCASVHAPVADTVTYFAGLDAPVVDTMTYFGGNHGSRV